MQVVLFSGYDERRLMVGDKSRIVESLQLRVSVEALVEVFVELGVFDSEGMNAAVDAALRVLLQDGLGFGAVVVGVSSADCGEICEACCCVANDGCGGLDGYEGDSGGALEREPR